ncbi:NAD(P)/FAD-dependent oxidoreductase [Methylosinus sp. Ce-a6]|uniref:phytoene desaturase family protein n=1 Tax=Methylosinus sp. Ce-a6 TaxID=2172005 RepID=UPI001358B125|nr:NAD(P)/FAD-dependent oxidoreductase [Methylosinus sp. Ce-a6]
MSDAKRFDAVVIGSGLGGLTAGALLAKQGYGVLLLERNFSLGGAASVYKVGGLTVEASLHQTSDPRNPRDPKRRILDELGILDEIEWISTGPLYTARGGPLGEPFTLPAGFDAAASALAERFPAHGKTIERFLGSLDAIQDALWNLSGESAPIGKSAERLASCAPAAADWTSSLADVLAREFRDDEAIKCALGANLFYYGDDPRRMWFVYYALAQGSNIGCGGAYIKGGSRQLSLKLAKAITKAGGSVRLGRAASAIETDADGRPTALRHVNRKSGEDEERVATRIILAGCGPDVVADLLPAPARSAFEAAFAARALSTSLFCAHYGLSAPPTAVGFEDYSSILLPDGMTSFDQYDAAGLLGRAPEGDLPPLGVANFGAIDSGLWETPPVLLSVLGLDRVGNWEGVERDAARARRELWLDALLARLERDYPGVSALVQERTLLTANSMRGYLNTPAGAVYGFAATPPTTPIEAGFPRTPKTPLPGLYLSSAFGGEHGFNGAMLSGAEAAKLAALDLAGAK